ncbi:MAG: Gldg family protein [Candidatus Omnitrophota bacterium]
MKNIYTIFMREIRAYFNSAIAYIFIIVFLLISGGIFMAQFFLISDASMRGFFNILPVILCVFLPAITMGLWAEDRKRNTLELLLTFPMRTHELVLGKYLGSLAFFIVSLLATITIPLTIIVLGEPDSGVIVCQYIGTILMGSFFLSLGIFVSGFCKDQIVSFIVSMMACFGFFLLGTSFTAASIDGWIPGIGFFLRNSLGMAYHFDSFQKGVIDIGDIIYFLIGTVVFLVLNGFWLESRLRPRAKIIFTTACLIGVGIFAVVNFIFADLSTGRFDFTELKTHTISSVSREVLLELKAPVLVKLFISPPDKMPSGLKMLEREIRDKLDEFKASSKGKFNYKVFHLEAANVSKEQEDTIEKSIEKKGVRPLRVRSIEADEVEVKLIYSAISLAYKERPEEIIPRVLPDNLQNLEYIIMSRICRMTIPKAPSIALMAPYQDKATDPKLKEMIEEMGGEGLDELREDGYKLIPRMLEYEGYEVKRIRLTEDEPIPEGCDTLIIIEPRKLNDRQEFEINRFLVGGGSLFLAVQKYGFEYLPYEAGGIQIAADDKLPEVNNLLKAWGLGIDQNFLMDLQCDVVSMTGGRLYGVIPVSSPIKLPIQPRITAEQMNKDISITSNLDRILYLWGSPLDLDYEKLNSLNLKTEVLFTSSTDAWKVPFHEGALTNEDLDVPAKDKRESFPLAVFVEGQFPDAFKDKDMPEWPKNDTAKEAEDESYEKPKEKGELLPKPGKLILIGCSGIFSEQLFDKGGHVNFFLNSIDTITLGGKLINVRSKQTADRTIKRLTPAAKAGWRIFNTFFVPILLVAIGGTRLFMRKRSKWVYLKAV